MEEMNESDYSTSFVYPSTVAEEIEDDMASLATENNANFFNISEESSVSTTEFPWTINSTTTTMSTTLDCTSLDYNYDPVISVISVALFMFGIFLCIFGYRCFKAVLFLTGFSFALVITFGLCQVEELLPQYGNVGVSTLVGGLFGLICYLVPYVGFFTLGFIAGLLSGLASMLFFPIGYSIWISVIFLLGTGLIGAVANVCWPTLTTLTTSLIGGAGIVVCFDYFVEKGRMATWVWGHSRTQEAAELCWFSWLLLIIWPVLLVVGLLVQTTLTANGFSLEIYGYHDSKRNPPRRRLTREERALARQAKYRYLYQVRTAGGDYISQAYIQFLQNRTTPHADTLSTHMSTLPTSSQEDSAIN